MSLVVYAVYYKNNYDCVELVDLFTTEEKANEHMETLYKGSKYAYVDNIEVKE